MTETIPRREGHETGEQTLRCERRSEAYTKQKAGVFVVVARKIAKHARNTSIVGPSSN